jgi:hypothetical protein
MQVICDEAFAHIKIDTAKVRALLVQHGLTDNQIDPLRIHVQHAPSEKQLKSIRAQGDGSNGTWGLHSGNDIYVFTNKRSSPMGPSLNRTLLHELRHHIKGDYQPGEIKLPHAERPSEIDAYAFADQYAPQQMLLTIPGETPTMEEQLTAIVAIEAIVIGVVVLLGTVSVTSKVLKRVFA